VLNSLPCSVTNDKRRRLSSEKLNEEMGTAGDDDSIATEQAGEHWQLGGSEIGGKVLSHVRVGGVERWCGQRCYAQGGRCASESGDSKMVVIEEKVGWK